MKNILLISMLIVAMIVPSRSQDSTRTDYPAAVNASLYMMTGILVPLAVAGTVISFFPPSFGIVSRDGIQYAAYSVESGVGFGEKRETGIFSDYRIMLRYTHIYNSHIRDLFRIEGKKDFHFDFIDRRKIFLSGCDLSAGVMTDFPNYGYTVGGGVWLQSPWISFFGLFPSHTYGITYRYNSYFSGKSFHEVSLGVTSSFTF